MKCMKKLIGLAMTVMLLFAMSIAVSAGQITIIPSDDSMVLTGKSFTAYRILDATMTDFATSSTAGGTTTVQYAAYTVPDIAALKAFYKGALPDVTADPAHEPQFSKDVVEAIANLGSGAKLQDFAKKLLADTAVKQALIAEAASYTGSVSGKNYVIDNLPGGYYLIEDTSSTGGDTTPISALMLGTVGGSGVGENKEIVIKASKPTIDKTIEKTDSTGTTGTVNHNNASVGDRIHFLLTSKVPDMTGYEKYYFYVTDTLSEGLTFDQTSLDGIEITIGDKKLVKGTKGQTSSDYDYYVEVTPEVTAQITGAHTTTVKIVFHNFKNKQEYKGKDIHIRYTAVLNQYAKIGSDANVNSVKLTYSNNPNVTGGGEDEPGSDEKDKTTGETPDHTTYTFVSGLKIRKIDGSNALGSGVPIPLKGAEFEIKGTSLNQIVVKEPEFEPVVEGDGTTVVYWALKNGTYTQTDPDDPGIDRAQYVNPDEKFKLTYKTSLKTSGETEINYKVTTGSDGFAFIDGLGAGTYTITETKAPDGYSLAGEPIELTIGVGYTGDADSGYTASWNASLKAAGTDVTLEPIENGVVTLEIKNNIGTLLPETGGSGTAMIYLIGGILIAGAGLLLILKKKRSSKE